MGTRAESAASSSSTARVAHLSISRGGNAIASFARRPGGAAKRAEAASEQAAKSVLASANATPETAAHAFAVPIPQNRPAPIIEFVSVSRARPFPDQRVGERRV
ncbi:hypothetical protein BMMON2_43110 [Burkholderia mallei]